MKKYIDSKIIILNNVKYLVYLKRVIVKANKQRKNGTTIKAFVKRLEK
jgi:hypothetical protein